jgi:virulence factor Mce-like protein
MSRRQGTAALVASPVLVGAVTVLVAIISVLIAVQANQGLPFVPTYDLKAEIPGGSNLVVGNEVRMGGFRVGHIETLKPAVSEQGKQRAIAVIDMKLDKRAEPLATDSRIEIRPRSALGLKYIQLTPGNGSKMYEAGSTIPLKQSVKPIELDEFFGIYDDETRQNQRKVFEGFGTAFAGRGDSINRAIEDLVPFVTHLRPVMRSLNAPETQLGRFFRMTRRTSGQLAPVARTYASLFVNMAGTFEALTRHPENLRLAIQRAPDTLESGIRSFPVQRPFLRDSGDLARRLGPVADEIERSLPPTSAAFRVGAPVLNRAPPFYRRTRDVFRSLEKLTANPNTLLALKDLRRTFEVLAPLAEYVAPHQTVCNGWNYYWSTIGEHVSENVRGGTIQRTNLKSASAGPQDNRVNSNEADRPADVPFNQDPQQGATTPDRHEPQALHTIAYWPAVDAQGNADCVRGQMGYLDGPFGNWRYGPREDGGQHTVAHGDLPGLSGATYKSRELGIDNVKDVP